MIGPGGEANDAEVQGLANLEVMVTGRLVTAAHHRGGGFDDARMGALAVLDGATAQRSAAGGLDMQLTTESGKVRAKQEGTARGIRRGGQDFAGS